MITLPALPAPNGVDPQMIDYGVTLRGALGGAAVRVNRPGNRFRLAVSFPLMTPDVARVFVSRLLRAKYEGLRMPFPLLSETQGTPGTPVVDGAGQAGTSLAIRGVVPSYLFREGFWISILGEDRWHLHNVTNAVTASAGGMATLSIAPALRFPFPDGAPVNVAQPMVDGFIEGDTTDWSIRVNRLVQIGFTIEEFA